MLNIVLPVISKEKKSVFCINNLVITLLRIWDLKVKVDGHHSSWGKTCVKKMWTIQAVNVSAQVRTKPRWIYLHFNSPLPHWCYSVTADHDFLLFLFFFFLITLLFNCRPWYWELRTCLEKIFGNPGETSIQGQGWFFQSINKNIFDPGSSDPLAPLLHEKD